MLNEKTLNSLVEQRITQMQNEQDRLVETWNVFVNAADEYTKKEENRELNVHERRNIAQCLENAFIEGGLKSRRKLFEATTEDSISFLGIQLPVIAALLPSLVANEISIVQALDRRIGAVFFLNLLYGNTKGSITAGDTMISSRTGHTRTETGRRYASDRVDKEFVSTSHGSSATLTGTLDYYPGVDVTTGSIVIIDGSGAVIGHDRAIPGTIAGTNCTGTVTAAGAYSLTPVSHWDSEGVYISYNYQYDKPVNATTGEYTGVPEVDVSLVYESITARDFPLRARYSLGAEIDLQKAHGISLENELVKFLGGEVRFTIDHTVVDMIDDTALTGVYVDNVLQSPAAAITSWNAQIGAGQEWVFKKHEFNDRIEEGNNNIIEQTLRGLATFILAGNNVARVIKQLPDFKPVGNINKTPPTGPVKLGTLNGRTVIQDPLFTTKTPTGGSAILGKNRYVLGWRGDNFLMAGCVYAPYIPLFATPTLVTSDLRAQKGFLSSAGFKIINAGMYTYGEISNLGTSA